MNGLNQRTILRTFKMSVDQIVSEPRDTLFRYTYMEVLITTMDESVDEMNGVSQRYHELLKCKILGTPHYLEILNPFMEVSIITNNESMN